MIPGVVAAPAGLGGLNGDATPGGFGNVTGSFNVNGQRNQSNNFLLDGASNNDTFNTGFVMRPPPDAIQEFKIVTSPYSAEYGRNFGGQILVGFLGLLRGGDFERQRLLRLQHRLGQRPGVADAARAAVTHEVVADLVEVLLQARRREILGDDL